MLPPPWEEREEREEWEEREEREERGERGEREEDTLPLFPPVLSPLPVWIRYVE